MWCKVHFDISNGLGVARQCDERKDRRADRTAVSNRAVYRPALKTDRVQRVMQKGDHDTVDTMTFSDPDFLTESNNLTIERRFHAMTVIFGPLTLDSLAI